MRRLGLAAAVLALAPLGGCAAVSTSGRAAPGCAVGETRQEIALVMFGRNIGDKLGVSEEDFARFLDREVSPRFPSGLTVVDSQGRWLDKGVLWKEPGKAMTLILERPDDRRRLAEVATAYETQFHQDAVLLMILPACVSFHASQAR